MITCAVKLECKVSHPPESRGPGLNTHHAQGKRVETRPNAPPQRNRMRQRSPHSTGVKLRRTPSWHGDRHEAPRTLASKSGNAKVLSERRLCQAPRLRLAPICKRCAQALRWLPLRPFDFDSKRAATSDNTSRPRFRAQRRPTLQIGVRGKSTTEAQDNMGPRAEKDRANMLSGGLPSNRLG